MAPSSYPGRNFGSLLECEHPGPRGGTHVTFGKEDQKLKKKGGGTTNCHGYTLRVASRRGSWQLPLGNNKRGRRGRAVPPGPRRREPRGSSGLAERVGRELGRAGGRRAERSSALVPRPQLRTGPRWPHARSPWSTRGADAARTTSPRKPRGRRGAEPGAIPRDPARWEAPLRTQWLRQRRPEGGERAGGRGGGGADVGWSAACQGGGWPGRRLAALGAGFAAGTALAARSRLGERRTEVAARGAPARRVAQHAARRPTPRRGAPIGGAAARGPALGRGTRSAAAAWL